MTKPSLLTPEGLIADRIDEIKDQMSKTLSLYQYTDRPVFQEDYIRLQGELQGLNWCLKALPRRKYD